MHIGFGTLPVDRRQIQRALPGHLQKLTPLGLRLLRLVSAKPQPSDQSCQHNNHPRTAGAIGVFDGGVGSPSASSAADSGSKSSMSMSMSALSSWATSES